MPDPSVPVDLGPAAATLAAVATGVRDDQLTAPTPCEGMSVGDLLHHVEGLALGFTWAARKQPPPAGVDPAPSADAAQLDPDWRTAVPALLAEMAAAWREPGAWTGPTQVGGVDQDGAECAATGADELVVHTWDLARATGQDVDLDPDAVALATGFAGAVAASAPDGVPGLFGPARDVPADADPVTRLLALTGRDPRWRRPAG